MITAEKLREVLDYEPHTGDFTWRVALSKRVKVGARAGCVEVDKAGLKYVRIGLFGRPYRAHRLAWLHVHGEWPSDLIDHISGDTLDNRICNLREANSAQNGANCRMLVSNTSGIKGVSWHRGKGRWQARINIDGKLKHLGWFREKPEAADAYRRAAEAVQGQFARAV